MVKRRKSKVLPPPSARPLRECTRLLAGAWTADVIWYLREGERCFTELQNDLQGVSAKVLTSCLRRLEQDGVIQRLTRPTTPPTVWYLLTPVGHELSGALTNVVEIAQRLGDRCRHLIRRVEEHAQYVSSRKGNEDLSGGAARLQVALALAGREIVTPRITPEGDAVGVGLVNALKARAVVMWRTHADVMPDEAAAMTVLVLADLHDAGGQAGVRGR